MMTSEPISVNMTMTQCTYNTLVQCFYNEFKLQLNHNHNSAQMSIITVFSALCGMPNTAEIILNKQD